MLSDYTSHDTTTQIVHALHHGHSETYGTGVTENVHHDASDYTSCFRPLFNLLIGGSQSCECKIVNSCKKLSSYQVRPVSMICPRRLPNLNLSI